MSAIERLPISITDYFTLTGKNFSDYNLVRVNAENDRHYGSGSRLNPMSQLRREVDQAFSNRIPKSAEIIIGYQEEVLEKPTSFWDAGFQRVNYSGVAIVPKVPD